MSYDMTTETVYLITILFIIAMQVAQWYYVFKLRTHIASLWIQLTMLSIVVFSKEKNEADSTEKDS